MSVAVQKRAFDSETVSGRAYRFVAVTLVTATLGQLLLFLFFGVLGWNPIIANVIAVVIVAIVGFILSIRYVWTEESSHSRKSQISAFVGSALLGLAISTLSIQFVTARLDHALAANIGSAAGYGVVWILRFGILETYVFRGHSSHTD